MLKQFAAICALMATPIWADTVAIKTATGTVELAGSPEKVIVFDVALLDTLDALGITVAGVPNSVLVDYLDDATKDATVVGTLFEPDFEAVNAMHPDLVIVGARSSTQAEALSKIAPLIDMSISNDTFEEGIARLDALGALFNKRKQADQIEAALQAKRSAAQQAAAGQGKALIILTNGPKISAYGAGGRFGWMHKALDLPQAVPDLGASTHGEAVSHEFIREANPDILIVIDRIAAIGQTGDNAQSTLDNALVHETAAWKNGKVIYLNAADTYIAGGGVQSLSRTLDQFISTFQSD